MRRSLVSSILLASINFSSAAFAEQGCNVNIEQALQQAALQGAQISYTQMQLGQAPKTSELSCIEAILDYSVNVLISIPNLGRILSEAIERGCNAAQAAVDDATENLQFSWDGTNALGLGNLPGTTHSLGLGNSIAGTRGQQIPTSNWGDLFR